MDIATEDTVIIENLGNTTLAENFSTLVGLVGKVPGLGATLSFDGQFTVFAPLNTAFPGDADAVEAFLQGVCKTDDVSGAIENILLHHVADGRRFSNSLLGGKGPKAVDTLHEMIFVNDDLTITDGAGNASATILAGVELTELGTNAANISASNGVIHVIDTVLFPEVICPVAE